MNLERAVTILAAVDFLLVVFALWKMRGVEDFARHEHLESLAKMSVDYSTQMGAKSNEELLAHAADAFVKLDMGDNGKRDYTDGEARIAIEAEVLRRKVK